MYICIIVNRVIITEYVCIISFFCSIVSAARSLTCRDDLDSKWQLLLAENELSCVSLLSFDIIVSLYN